MNVTIYKDSSCKVQAEQLRARNSSYQFSCKFAAARLETYSEGWRLKKTNQRDQLNLHRGISANCHSVSGFRHSISVVLIPTRLTKVVTEDS